jgi:predicted Zn-dependent peptidase
MKQLSYKDRQYDSGFKARVLQRPGFAEKFMGIIVDFGSNDPQAVAGSAHFLEHALFNKKSGDISLEFEKLTADVNAFTSNNETCFYCTTTGSYRRLLPLLFQLVGQADFTAASVKKELPIIQQEIAMYQDDPAWLINDSLMRQLFPQQLAGMDIAGNKESVAKITPASLRSVYQANYQPAKMAFVASGDFSAYQANDLLREVGKLSQKYWQKSEKSTATDQIQLPSASSRIVAKSSGLFGLALKLPNFKKVLACPDLAQIILEIMLESKLSAMGPWFMKMEQQQLLTQPLLISVEYSRQGAFALIAGFSDQSEAAIKEIKLELNQPLGTDAYYQDFLELQKKRVLADDLRQQDNLANLAIASAEDFIGHNDWSRDLLQLQNLGFQEFKRLSQQLLQDYQLYDAWLVKKEG